MVQLVSVLLYYTGENIYNGANTELGPIIQVVKKQQSEGLICYAEAYGNRTEIIFFNLKVKGLKLNCVVIHRIRWINL